MEVVVLNRQRAHAIARRPLEAFLSRLAHRVPAAEAGSIALCLVSDRRMRELNRDFRGSDCSTDVLSFPAGAPSVPDAERHLGDIVISVETALQQAGEAGHSLSVELQTLSLHGYLHLLGYDHETDDGAMMRLQRKLARELVGVAGRQPAR